MSTQKSGHPKQRSFKPLTPREAALDILTSIEEQKAYSNLLLNQTLQKQKWSPQDSAFITELVYGTVQRLNTIDYVLSRFVTKGLSKLAPWVRALLRMSVYQIRYLDRVPDHAVVNESVQTAKKRGHQGISGMVNGVLRNLLRTKDAFDLDSSLPEAERISLAHSHPLWMIEDWIQQYGAETAARMAEANNVPPSLSLRVNRLRATREEVVKKLQEDGRQVRPSLLSEWGIVAEKSGNLALHPLFLEGKYSVQDESSMLVAQMVDPQPGMMVLDCCSAPGGKSAHMAEWMQNKGQVIANDIHPHKEKLIRDQMQRLGLTCVKTNVSDASKLGSQFPAQSFDRILLDAPCSGLGVIRRKPDLKWMKNREELKGLPPLQVKLLEEAAPLLKIGGFLVYSTCTVEYAENVGVVQAFLEKHPEFKLDQSMSKLLPPLVTENMSAEELNQGYVQILPHQYHSDGFFIARLCRTC
ncbi:16S rRNA (cytosine(967)-C(5))-methyltransferase RsmB [Marinicrinis lubricantis]|uniref:16S rRNA (cytosine(967)-C(5))-methyltransferase n=1 Tax=Marinicrinis lubricantis TaxID=2086470 RepID=A0ABW1IMU0_9BACL